MARHFLAKYRKGYDPEAVIVVGKVDLVNSTVTSPRGDTRHFDVVTHDGCYLVFALGENS